MRIMCEGYWSENRVKRAVQYGQSTQTKNYDESVDVAENGATTRRDANKICGWVAREQFQRQAVVIKRERIGSGW